MIAKCIYILLETINIYQINTKKKKRKEKSNNINKYMYNLETNIR